jgi:fatty-acyl-CoA synthase
MLCAGVLPGCCGQIRWTSTIKIHRDQTDARRDVEPNQTKTGAKNIVRVTADQSAARHYDTRTSAALSYVNGSSDRPLRYETLGAALRRAAAQWGERDALIACHQGVRLKYHELNARCETLAAGFLTALQPGDRIGIYAANCVEWMLTQYAAAKAGLILVNINPASRARELAHVLKKAGCKALVTAARFKSSDYLAMLCELAPEIRTQRSGALELESLPALRWIMSLEPCDLTGVETFDAVAGHGGADQRAQLEALAHQLQPDDPVNIQFTSGTTGSPKGATLTHFNILNNGLFTGHAMRLTPGDRVCIPVPLYHCVGMVMGNLGCLTHGAAAVYPAAAFEPLSVLKALSAERCTAMYGVPTMFMAILNHPERGQYDLSSVRTGSMAGAPCPVALMQRVVTEMNMREITIAYGMTETSPVSFQSDVDESLERRVTTVGRIHPHLEAKVVDVEGRVVPRGVSGELCTRGYSLMRGYWGEPEKTAEAIDAAGWMHTGDVAVLDPEGYCNIVGRIKDIVIRGGENIYPREVEEFLLSHPQVQAAACFGVPDPFMGEELCAWVQLRAAAESTEAEIRGFCKGRIAHYKVPRYVRFVESYPMTVSGKIQKFLMREQMIEELGLAAAVTA